MAVKRLILLDGALFHFPVAFDFQQCFCFVTDSFVNSQEWTASRGVTELRVGVLGSPDSGKSSLVHRYLTGTYMQEESPEGT